MTADQIKNIEHKLAFGIGTALIVYLQTQPTNGLTEPLTALGGLLVAWSGIKSHAMNADAPASSPASTVVTTATKLIVLGLLCVGLSTGCKTSQVTTAAKANAATVATVDAAMTSWSTWVNTHPTTPASQILAVSNAYNVYYNTELLFSNTLAVYAENPSTNNAAIVTATITGVTLSTTNLINIVSTFSK